MAEPALPDSLTNPSIPISNGTSVDVEMSEAQPAEAVPEAVPEPIAEPVAEPVEQSVQTPQPPTLPTPTHLPSTSTPSRNTPQPSTQQSAPTHPNPHGSPTRVYLNTNVTPHLLEAMKHLVTAEPDKPLKWLSEFLAQKSLEIEGP